MANIVVDNMTGANWDDINERSGALGSTWTYHPATLARWYIFSNRVHCGVPGLAYASGIPPTANYSVECNYIIFTTVTTLNLGIAGRMDTTADTYYTMYYQAGEVVLAKRVAGVTTSLNVWTSTLSGGGTGYIFTLEMIGSAIKGYVNGTLRVSATDATITAAGRAGVRSVGSNDASTGSHIDDFLAYDASVAAAGRVFASGFVGI